MQEQRALAAWGEDNLPKIHELHNRILSLYLKLQSTDGSESQTKERKSFEKALSNFNRTLDKLHIK